MLERHKKSKEEKYNFRFFCRLFMGLIHIFRHRNIYLSYSLSKVIFPSFISSGNDERSNWMSRQRTWSKSTDLAFREMTSYISLTSWKRWALETSSSLFLSITFTATFSPVKTCRASFTTAKWPRPRVSSRS